MSACMVRRGQRLSSPRHEVDAEVAEGLQQDAGGLVEGIDLLVHECLSQEGSVSVVARAFEYTCS